MVRRIFTNRTVLSGLLAFLIACSPIIHVRSSCSVRETKSEDVIGAAHKLGADLMRIVSKESRSNIIISPLSILLSLQILLYAYEPADKAHRQLAYYLGPAYSRAADKGRRSQDILNEATSKMIGCMRQQERPVLPGPTPKPATNLTMTNVLIVEDQSFGGWAPSFKSGVSKYYSMQFERFSHSDKRSIASMCDRVNKLASQQTNGAIDHVVDPSEMSQLVAIIMNVAYLKGAWRYKFDNTYERKFHNYDYENYNHKQEKETVFMTRQAPLRYLDLRRSSRPIRETKSRPIPNIHRPDLTIPGINPSDLRQLDCEVLALPIDEDGLSMVILMPFRAADLDRLYDAAALLHVLKQLRKTQPRIVYVEMPKFIIDREYSMTDYVKQLGIGTALFDEPTRGGLVVGEIKHKAKMNITESGLEASAVTEIKLLKSSWASLDLEPEVVFRADRPFVFAVVHLHQPAPVFMGQVVEL